MKVLKFLPVLALLAVTAFAADDECLRCHGQTAAAKESGAPTVMIEALAGSIHSGLGCNDCHNVNPNIKHVGTADILCGKCHLEAAEGYARSPHVKGREVSLEDIPTCITCHGGHEILATDNPESVTNHRNSVKICIKCHEDESLRAKFDILPEPQMIKAYENSVHGRALMVEGNMDAPACVDCHGSHSFMPSDDPESPVFKTHISGTCGACHAEIAGEYNSSVHGAALAEGILESPTCTDCHGEHDIKAHLDPDSRVYTTNVPKTCSDCHTSEKVVGKFGLKPDRIATFNESYHGVAIELGATNFANCASCHGVHNIYPQSDPRSLINAANIEQTCGRCHDDLPADFAKGTVHTSASDKSSGGKFYVRKFYIWFISILILGFIIYRILEYKRRVKRVQ
ncbi:MAG: cytochrome c3 family protein [Candidatus Zixiibacteriota bacterium]